MSKILVCKEKINENGRICYGKSFQILQGKKEIYSKCEKCGKENLLWSEKIDEQ